MLFHIPSQADVMARRRRLIITSPKCILYTLAALVAANSNSNLYVFKKTKVIQICFYCFIYQYRLIHIHLGCDFRTTSLMVNISASRITRSSRPPQVAADHLLVSWPHWLSWSEHRSHIVDMGGLGLLKPGIASSTLAWGTYLLFYVGGEAF